MGQVMAGSVSDLESLVPSWRLSLQAANKSKATITSYTYATTQFAAYLRDHGMPSDVTAITREYVESFLRDLIESRSASTAETRYRGLRQFFGWAEDEGEITRSPMAKMKPPAVAEQPVDVPSVEDLQALLAVCGTNDFEGRRDTAIIRLFLDSGLRLAELTGLTMDALDLGAGMVGVTGKGDRYRTASFGAKTAKAIDRYLRVRRGRADADLAEPLVGSEGSDDRVGGPSDAVATFDAGRDRTAAPAPTPALLRPRLARRRRHRGRPDDARRMAHQDDGHAVRIQHPSGAGA